MPEPKTRSRRTAVSVKHVVKATAEEKPEEPLKLLVLPKGVSANARICTIPHPRTSVPCRYYVCPEKGIFEFQRIAPAKTVYQSWLVGRQHHGDAIAADINVEKLDFTLDRGDPDQATVVEAAMTGHPKRPISEGYTIKSPDLLVATPVDPLFLILPSLLASSAAKSPSSKGMFLSFDDLFDKFCEESSSANELVNTCTIRNLIQDRMRMVCDTVDAGDEEMFRLSTGKLLTELLTKAKRLVASGIPTSMEDKFVCKALERPVMAIKRKDSTTSETILPSQGEGVDNEPNYMEPADSQASTASASIASEASSGTNITIPDGQAIGERSKDMKSLMRLQIALSYIFTAYIPRSLVITLQAELTSEYSPIDFSSLEQELVFLDNMRREALASRSFSDFSRKRGVEDEELAQLRAEKKAKKEEEEKKRKASETRGVRDLKKVDTVGMKKMSDFFRKCPR